MIQFKKFHSETKGGIKMDRESYLYMRARNVQKTACADVKKKWDINYILKFIDEWEKMQRLFKEGNNEKKIYKK